MRVLLTCVSVCALVIWAAHTYNPTTKASSSATLPPSVAQTHSGAQDTMLQKVTGAIATIESHRNPMARRFEPHVFARLSGQKATTFQEAKRMNWRAAMMATACGQFQILGANYRRAGYADIVEMFHADSMRQVKGFHTFLRNNGLIRLVHERKWKAFARCYNGKGYRRTRYDEKLTNLMEG